jgi:hypothetical protein
MKHNSPLKFFHLSLGLFLTIALFAQTRATQMLRLAQSPATKHMADDHRSYSNSQGYLLPKWFELDTRLTDNYIFVHLNHLDDMFKRDRKVYLRNLARNRYMIRLEP